ncbi:hypothetical protein GIB67_006598 [Kingdonia uniflora]|uniref:TF-B3 domain-containing protein n=1 Tax=Kingdonia uniflora TaxID=39325 RepID=A0A7J7LEU8_9MAGN|nr:hypothetical protein GIB67_006598 [Kingdonia uniflora]
MNKDSSFFRVMVDDFTKTIRLPLSIEENVNGMLMPDSEFILTYPSGRCWLVKVERDEKGFFLEHGWEGFVKDNSLKIGEFLIFTYSGNSKFDVKIFGTNGLEKGVTSVTAPKTSCVGEKHKRVMRSTVYKRTPEEEPVIYVGTTVKKRSKVFIDVDSDEDSSLETLHPSPINKRQQQGNNKKCHREVKVENEDAVVNQTLGGFKSKCPFFKVNLKRTYMSKGYLVLPTTFVRKHLTDVSKKPVILNDSKGRKWPARLSVNKTSARIFYGWYAFLLQNKLEEGDNCVFELIKMTKEEAKLKVSIFRANLPLDNA